MPRVLAYKLAKPDGWDFFTGKTINYRENIGKVIRPPVPNSSLGICSSGVLHASLNPNGCFEGATIPCSVYRVSGIPVCGNDTKLGFLGLRVIREIFELDELFGWRISEASNPINPFKLPKIIEITPKHLEDLKRWDSLGASVRDSIWTSVLDSICTSGLDLVWASVRDSIWTSVWNSVGILVGASVRDSVRTSVLDSIWAYIGSMFPNVKDWLYAPKDIEGYPYQSCVDLWKCGIIPSFDGKIWRLHSGSKADIVWQGN